MNVAAGLEFAMEHATVSEEALDWFDEERRPRRRRRGARGR